MPPQHGHARQGGFIVKKNTDAMPPYSLVNNILYIIKKTWKLDKRLLLGSVIKIPVTVLIPLATTYLSGAVVRLITENESAEKMLLTVVSFSALLLFLNTTNIYSGIKLSFRSLGVKFSFITLCSSKSMDLDYDIIEDPDGQVKMQRALDSLGDDSSGAQQILSQLVNIVSNFLGLISYTVILLQLNVWIVLLLLATTLSVYFLNKKNNLWVYEHKDEWISLDRKIKYINTRVSSYEFAKDLRIYNMKSWFDSLLDSLTEKRLFWCGKAERRSRIIGFISAALTAARECAVYLTLIYMTLNGGLSAADFVLYTGLVSQYSNWLLGIVNSYNALQISALQICDLRGFLELENRTNRGKGIPAPDGPPEISFENVSYKYPLSDRYVLRNLSFRINGGEKIALVGYNGAGKTTLIKLLCGLYSPTDGVIRVNGHKISEYNIHEYHSVIAAVFQDIYFLPTSMAKNIALCADEKIDRALLHKVCIQSGLDAKIQSLRQKENTHLIKGISENATDLSGGEKQKLALARALYKGGSIVILDEPTAALDAIAENEMYQKYNELTGDATSIFISHRLSSTRFCDRILFLENGEIAETGTHDQLIVAGGKYARMFGIQSHYYQEEDHDETAQA